MRFFEPEDAFELPLALMKLTEEVSPPLAEGGVRALLLLSTPALPDVLSS